MELKISWMQLAQDKLHDIFDYYKFKAGPKIARKIINEIIERAASLENQPEIGTIEELLIERP